MLQLAFNNPTRTAIGTVVAVTVLGIALQGWRFATTLAAQEVAVSPAPKASASPAAVARISAAGLFGQAGSAGAGGPAATPPESNLGWVLRGVFTGPSPETGSAIIETEPGKSHLVRAGQSLPANGRLVAVYDDRVVIDHSGQRETLRFPIPTATSGTPDVEQVLKQAAQYGVKITPERREEIRKRLEQLRERARGASSENSR